MVTKMQDLSAEVRAEIGTNKLPAIRKNGYIPAVFYGRGQKSLSLKVKEKDLKNVYGTEAGTHVIINLKITGAEKPLEQPAITQELTHDVLTDQIIHIDFRALELKEKLQTTVPINLVGEAAGIKSGGIIITVLREVKIECLPLEIPAYLEMDISGLELSKSFHISDLKVDQKKIKILTPLEEVAVSCILPKEEVEEVAPTVEITQPEIIGKGKKEEEVAEEGAAEAKPAEKVELVKSEKPAKTEKAAKTEKPATKEAPEKKAETK